MKFIEYTHFSHNLNTIPLYTDAIKTKQAVYKDIK